MFNDPVHRLPARVLQSDVRQREPGHVHPTHQHPGVLLHLDHKLGDNNTGGDHLVHASSLQCGLFINQPRGPGCTGNCTLNAQGCPAGTYLAGCGGTSAATCKNCTNTLNPGDEWVSNGGINPIGCMTSLCNAHCNYGQYISGCDTFYIRFNICFGSAALARSR